jgi:hypothetical protein
MSISRRITPPHVVGEDDHDVRLGRRFWASSGVGASRLTSSKSGIRDLYIGNDSVNGEFWRIRLRIVLHKELHRPLDNRFPGWIDLRVDATPIAARIFDDHDLNACLNLTCLLLHVVSMFNRNRRNHTQFAD